MAVAEGAGAHAVAVVPAAAVREGRAARVSAEHPASMNRAADKVDNLAVPADLVLEAEVGEAPASEVAPEEQGGPLEEEVAVAVKA